MQLSKEKIELLKKKLPELYEIISKATSLLEEDLNYVKSISREEIDKLENKDPSSAEIELKLDQIHNRANTMLEKLKQSLNDCRASLGLESKASLTEILLSKEFNESLTFNEKFVASAVATAITKIKCD